MTATTNGASLEDCLTNIFSLIDLNGIRWKRFKQKEQQHHHQGNNYLYTPIDTHPILTTYAKCIEENHIAVWRLEPPKKHSASTGANSHGGGGGNTSSTGHSNFPTPTRTSNNNTPTGGVPASLTNNNSNQNNNSQNNYELWIFGYGHQLKVDNVIGDDLVEIEDDTWESKGLSYECRTLLFKALHNLIERCLITKGFTKIGRWFVQPLAEDPLNHQQSLNSSHYGCPLLQKPFKQTKVEPSSITRQTNSSLSSTISSNLDRIIGIRAQNFESRQCLDKSDGLRHISIRSSSTYFTTSLDGSKLSLSFAFSFFVHGDSTICATVDVRQHPLIHPLTRQDLNTFQEGGIVRVALAPFGLNGILNGVSYKDCDDGAATTTFIQQWSKFYPLPKTLSRLSTCSKSSSNSAMSNFNQKGPTNTNQYNQTSDVQANNSSRSYLSNLTNMLLPPTQRPTISFNYEPNEVPPIVEVIVAGCRMRYPSECVFTTAKVVDPYKSLSMNSGQRLSNLSTHRKPNKNNHSKPNKLSLLSGKTNEEKLDPLVKVKEEPEQTKTQTNFNSPFRLSSSEGKNNTTTQKSDGATNMNSKQTSSFDSLRDKAPNGNFESSDTGNNLFNSTSNQTTISRYNSSKVGFSSSNAPLGPTDLVKLFPTPPSLEQIVLSPSGIAEESTIKEATVLSPANLTLNNSHFFKDNGIDVYKPVECAIMPPPPKWAALTNIVISSSKSLPPECIYKGSSQNNTSKNATKSSDFTKGTSIKNYCNTKQLHSTLTKTNSSQSISSPLTDQTNKNGFHNSNLNTPPAKTSTSSSLLTGPNQSTNSINQTNGSVCPSSTFTLFTLPHQKLFNNLNEVNSIQLNLMLSDSALGMFKDHNFESCTLCVCNMSVKGTQTDIIPQRAESNNLWRHTSGYDNIINSSTPTNEFTNECTCGFSAISNRHCSHLSGLFLEDELELTNVLYDPTEMIDQNKLFRKVRLSNYSEAACNDEQKLITKLTSDLASKTSTKSSDEDSKSNLKQDKVSKEDKSSQSNRNAFEEAKIFVIDQLKQQCTTMIHSNSSLSKVLLIESFRNNRHLTGCSNYYAQTSSKVGSNGPFFRFMDDSNKYTTVKMMNRNPTSLKFSDFCELTKSIITKLGNQNQMNSRLANSLVKPPGSTSSGLSAIFSRMFGSNRTSLIAKSSDASSRNNIFIQGLQALVVPTLSIDAKGALQMLEHLVKEESKEALATLNKAILIFSSPMHDWQFLTAPVPENNFDVANLLKIIQPSLEESIGSHNKLYKDFVHQQQQHLFSARDSPTGGAPTLPTPPCQGPLTWRLFHQAAGRGTEDQCEPQPIPSLLVGHNVEKNHLAVSPFALKFWDKLLLEPYAPSHNIFYLVIAPDNQNILGHINPFFKELSNTYELLKLGRHVPIGNGLIVATNPEGGSEEEDWFSKLDLERELSGNIISRLEAYASKLNSGLAKTIIDFIEERQPPYDPHADRFTSSPTPQNAANLPQTNRLSQYPANRTSKQLLSGFNSTSGASQDPQIYTSENPMSSDLVNQLKSQALIGSSTHGGTEDNVSSEDEINKQSGIVIYMIDPFSSPSITQNLRTLSTIGLFKCYSLLLEKLPESVRRITQLQLVSLDSILSHSRPILNISRVDQLKSLSMNVYSRCRKIVTNQATAKSLTGFGPSAALENFFKTKSNDLSITRMFTPPFILAPMKDKQTELVEIRQRLEISSVLFCSYCITEDQRWLLASLTNDKGEMSETTVININIIDRMKKPKTSVRRIALRKLMDFIVSTMSDWMNPWRLIIGKLGRVGHGELKEWASIMSKRSLLNYSRHLSDRCRQCSILPSTETVSILSACLVSLEPDSKLRIMPDQFTSDDRQASFNKCPLNTPEDASATHILVFPTSASIQSAHGNVEDPLAGSGLDDDLLNQFPLEDGIEDLGVEENMDDLFAGAWDDNPPNISDHISSHHDTMLSSSNLPLGSGSVGDNANNQDENLQLLQQPLALGYYISTAKIGQMPNWFWSTSPHLRNSCPVYLKSALHIHMPCVQLSDDLLHSGVGQQNRHQLDSNLTTDVLRYVLEGYNSLSWLALNPKTYDRQSCLPVHMQNLLQLYHLMESFS